MVYKHLKAMKLGGNAR